MALVNFISFTAHHSDREKMFGDEPADTFDPANETMAHLMLFAGAFSSLTQARKNGWDKPVTTGWSEHKVGKHTRLWIWNPK